MTPSPTAILPTPLPGTFSETLALREVFPFSPPKSYLELLSSGLHFPFSLDSDGRKRAALRQWGAGATRVTRHEEQCSSRSVSLLPHPLPPPSGKQSPGTSGPHMDLSPAPSPGLSGWCSESR